MIGINANFKRTPLKQRKSTVTKDIFIFSNFWQFFNFRKKHTHKLNLATHVNIDRIYIMSKWKGLWIIFNFYGRGAPAKRDFLGKFCQFSSPINLLKMKSVVEKLNVWTVELIFHLVSKNVVVLTQQSAGKMLLSLTYFQKVKNEQFQVFFLRSLAKKKGKRMCCNSHSSCRRVLPWCNAKAQRVGSSGYPHQLMLHTLPWPHHPFYFLVFCGVFWRTW